MLLGGNYEDEYLRGNGHHQFNLALVLQLSYVLLELEYSCSTTAGSRL